MLSSTFILFALFYLKLSLVLGADVLVSLGILSAILCAIIVCFAIGAIVRRLVLSGRRISKVSEQIPMVPKHAPLESNRPEESIPILSSPVSNPTLQLISTTSSVEEIEEASQVETSDSHQSLFEEYSKAHPLTDLEAFETFGKKVEDVFKKAIQEGQDIRSFKQECEELLRFFYKHLARQYHPDKTLSSDAEAFKRLSNQLEKIIEAWNQVEHKSEEEIRFYEDLSKMNERIKKEIQELKKMIKTTTKVQAQLQKLQTQTQEQLHILQHQTQEQLQAIQVMQSQLDELELQRRRPFSEKLAESCCIM